MHICFRSQSGFKLELLCARGWSAQDYRVHTNPAIVVQLGRERGGRMKVGKGRRMDSGGPSIFSFILSLAVLANIFYVCGRGQQWFFDLPRLSGLVKLHQARTCAPCSRGESRRPPDATGGCPIHSKKRCATSESEEPRKCRANESEMPRYIVLHLQEGSS